MDRLVSPQVEPDLSDTVGGTFLSVPDGRECPSHARGNLFWRSLEELADNAAFQEKVRQEFPHSADYWSDPISRRRFLMLMGASLGLAGLSGCWTSAPQQPIL